MKISEIITDKYKLRIPPTVYYELLADVREVEEEQEPTTKIDCNKTDCNKCVNHKYCDYEPTTKNDLGVDREDAVERLNAIKQLIGYDKDSEIVKATQKSLDMAIKALEQEPTDKNFTKADIDAIVKAINAHWELIIDEIRAQIKSNLRGVEIALEVLVESDPLRPKMEGAKDTLEDCLEIIDKAESEDQDGQTSN